MENIQKINGFGFIGILIVVAVIALIGGGGLYMREAQNQKSIERFGNEKIKEVEVLKQKIEEQQKQAQEMSGEKPAITNINTSTWKTYRNEKYGFEVRYPAIAKIKTNDHEDVFYFRIIGDSKSSILPMSIRVEDAKGRSVQDWIKNNVLNPYSRSHAIDITVDKEKGKLLPLVGDIGEDSLIVVMRNGNIYVLQMSEFLLPTIKFIR